jgi:hypothetical protein
MNKVVKPQISIKTAKTFAVRPIRACHHFEAFNVFVGAMIIW